ncbi:hypothetical protein FSP39_003993 [Pinctada imbricata]|uniref:EF-hand domain-containing protein n=1 Tax=Pinctada imbricata TaxID=66713 RepID=A0AA89C0H3_PINIB|nr:hypothetical protein FSP39_003993 [Pinctada imbricata]
MDILLSFDTSGHLNTSLYDKRDDFIFHITNFPFMSSNIPSSPAYGVFVSQLIRYARACSKYEDLIIRARRLASKLLVQGYVTQRLKSSLNKFFGRYGDLLNRLFYSSFMAVSAAVLNIVKKVQPKSGGKKKDSHAYAHFVFNTFDQDRNGCINFEDFVMGLSVLSRGTLQERLQWAFTLYDINGDGLITKDEMLDIVSAIYEMMGRFSEPSTDETTVRDHVNKVFQVNEREKKFCPGCSPAVFFL